VVGVDDLSQYPGVKKQAPERLKNYPNCTLVKDDALRLLRYTDAESVDLIFIDDLHDKGHIRHEALEAARILKPHGIVAFHDVFAFKLESMLKDVFEGWEYLSLPAFSPSNGTNYGLGIFKKPKRLCKHNWVYVEMIRDDMGDGTYDEFAVSRCDKCNRKIERFVRNE
jgi:SAM-dependent methyltransferase